MNAKTVFFCFIVTILISGCPPTSEYDELKMNPQRPYNAVGYLNNGGTAFLIDENHIVSAAHCFVDTKTGEWQSGLRFYPNFHPDRVTADAKHVPRGDVTHVVVGSRAGESVLGVGMDWGIARIENWQDIDGLDLTPATLAMIIPPAGTKIINPAYTRHHFPFNDNDAVKWDNMEWDATNCSWVGNNQGMWAIIMRPAPFYDGVNRDRVWCNSRWGAGMIHKVGYITNTNDNIIVHNGFTIGGSSGSPLISDGGIENGHVIAVIHGGRTPDFSQVVPTQSDSDFGNGADVTRFLYAPRFASNVAVHRRPDNKMATAVFAIDSDINRVVYRERMGDVPTYSSKFYFWKNLGTPSHGAILTRIAAHSGIIKDKPQIFVIADNSNIYTRQVSSNSQWYAWENFEKPNSNSNVIDIDATNDNNGRCQLFIVCQNEGIFTRAKTSDNVWGVWQSLGLGNFKRITALNYNNVIWAIVLDDAGQIWHCSTTNTGWTSLSKLGNPVPVNKWLDVDMTWDEHARGFMVAIPEGGGNKLWFMPMYGTEAWKWRYFDTHLWAPDADSPQDTPYMQSITASRWMEDQSNITSPVIFATDDYGNIYFIEYTRIGTPRWVLDWKSFYQENIHYSN